MRIAVLLALHALLAIAAAAALVLGAPPTQTRTSPMLRSGAPGHIVVATFNYDQISKNGILSINPQTGAVTQLTGLVQAWEAQGAAADLELGVYFLMCPGPQGYDIFAVNATDGSMAWHATCPLLDIDNVQYDPRSGHLIGIVMTDAANMVMRINPKEGDAVPVAYWPSDWALLGDSGAIDTARSLYFSIVSSTSAGTAAGTTATATTTTGAASNDVNYLMVTDLTQFNVTKFVRIGNGGESAELSPTTFWPSRNLFVGYGDTLVGVDPNTGHMTTLAPHLSGIPEDGSLMVDDDRGVLFALVDTFGKNSIVTVDLQSGNITQKFPLTPDVHYAAWFPLNQIGAS